MEGLFLKNSKFEIFRKKAKIHRFHPKNDQILAFQAKKQKSLKRLNESRRNGALTPHWPAVRSPQSETDPKRADSCTSHENAFEKTSEEFCDKNSENVQRVANS